MSLTADDFFVPKYQDESYVCGDWSDIFLRLFQGFVKLPIKSASYCGKITFLSGNY